MASWTNQSTSSLLPGEPWTSAKALAAFENPEAIAEGASGAPTVQYRALKVNLNQSFSGSGNAGGEVIVSIDAGSAARWVCLILGTYELTRVDSGGAEIYFQASSDNVNWTNIRVIVDDAGIVTGASISVEYNDFVGTGASYRYFRIYAFGDADHTWEVSRANLSLHGSQESTIP